MKITLLASLLFLTLISTNYSFAYDDHDIEKEADIEGFAIG